MALGDEYVEGSALQTTSSFVEGLAQWAEAAAAAGQDAYYRTLEILVTDASNIVLTTVAPFNTSSPHDRHDLQLAVEVVMCAEASTCAIEELDDGTVPRTSNGSDMVSRRQRRREESVDLVKFEVERTRLSSSIDAYSDGDAELSERISAEVAGSGSLPAGSVALQSAVLSRLSAKVTITQLEAPLVDDEVQAVAAALGNVSVLQASLTSELGELGAAVLQLSSPTVQITSPPPSSPPPPAPSLPPPSPASPPPQSPVPLPACPPRSASPLELSTIPPSSPLLATDDDDLSPLEDMTPDDADGGHALTVGLLACVVVLVMAAVIVALLIVRKRRQRRRKEQYGTWTSRVEGNAQEGGRERARSLSASAGGLSSNPYWVASCAAEEDARPFAAASAEELLGVTASVEEEAIERREAAREHRETEALRIAEAERQARLGELRVRKPMSPAQLRAAVPSHTLAPSSGANAPVESSPPSAQAWSSSDHFPNRSSPNSKYGSSPNNDVGGLPVPPPPRPNVELCKPGAALPQPPPMTPQVMAQVSNPGDSGRRRIPVEAAPTTPPLTDHMDNYQYQSSPGSVSAPVQDVQGAAYNGNRSSPYRSPTSPHPLSSRINLTIGGVSSVDTSPANLLIDGDGPIGLSAEELETLAQLKRSFSDMPAGAEKAGGASGRAEEDLRI